MRHGPPQPLTAKQRERAAEDARFGRRRVDQPQAGLYAVRMRKGAVEVAARITYEPLRDPETGEKLDRSYYFAAEINGEPDPDPQPEPNDRVWRVYEFGRRIERAEYDFLLADRAWAAEHAPELPEADPTKPIDLLKTPVPF